MLAGAKLLAAIEARLRLRDREGALRILNEMASGGLTQYTVALQGGVSQPVLCTYLGGRANGRAHGKNSKLAVRQKLIAWLGKRGVAIAATIRRLSLHLSLHLSLVILDVPFKVVLPPRSHHGAH